MARVNLSSLLTLQDFEDAASRLLPKMVHDYFRGGGESGATLAANLRAFEQFRLRPRVLMDVSKRSTRLKLAGHELHLPVVVAPMAVQKLAHRQGEIGQARAAATAGTIFTASTLSSVTLEEIAAATRAPKWFQLYVHSDRKVSAELVRRAAKAGYAALVLTVDVPVLSRRVLDARNHFKLPRGVEMANLAPFVGKGGESQLAEVFAARHDASLNWRDLKWLRSLSDMPLWLKGIVRGDDARRALKAGVDGIIVSNHGGRQLDGCVATLAALPEVVRAVRKRIPVLVDGGVRGGSDVLKALALGANAVMLGRPLLWGLAVGGEAGACRVFDIIQGEIDRALALCGCRSVADVKPDLVNTTAP
jgi:4-hydroxymandelate oxidase